MNQINPPLAWETMRRERKYLPARIEGDSSDVVRALQAIAAERGLTFQIDEMTDQIDVYHNGRKIAVYMP